VWISFLFTQKINDMKMPLLIAGTLLVSAAAIHHSSLCPFARAKGIVKQTRHVPAATTTVTGTTAAMTAATRAANSVAVNR
jgi:hypothetical protein